MGQIDLPARLNFQTNPADLEYRNALSRILYPQRIPSPYFYPKSPYGMQGLGADCLPYDFYALQQTFGVVDCGQAPYNSDPGTQYACQQKNAPLLDQIAQLSPSYGTCITAAMLPGPYTPSPVGTPASVANPYLNPFTGPGLLYNPANPATPSSSPQYGGPAPLLVIPAGGYTPPTSGSPTTYYPPTTPTVPPPATSSGGLPAVYHPVVSFQASRQGILYPGDKWVIQITGGQPNSVVLANSSQNGVANAGAQMGVTDQYGNFSLQGTIDSSSIGYWQETWSVGSQSAGSFSFTVASPSSPVTPPGSGSGSGTQSPPSGGGTGTSPPSGSGTTPPSTTLIPGLSNTVLLGGAGLLVLLVMMGGRR